ncbi:MAG: peptidoglycan-binding protein [Candidatus Nomurabacteria bacterium]|nr:peptidoglycan-binding protein [Candidatus Nomurabacteria bacterium]USN87473.1 MAG: peptidoglycan-binding protein [Candidatus Nomurabacteria bacterium]
MSNKLFVKPRFIMQVQKVSLSVLVISFVFALLFFLAPSFSYAQAVEDCQFSRTLEDGVDGEDVRCLQRYLNASGFQIAESGPGAPGGETSLFRTLTREAVVKWQQAKKITPASGVFGDKSRAVYMMDVLAKLQLEKSKQEAPLVTINPISVVKPQPTVVAQVTSSNTKDKEEAERQIIFVLAMIIDAYEEIGNIRSDDPDEAADIDEDVQSALRDLGDVLEQYFDGEFKRSKSLALDVLDDATDSFEDAGGESDKSKAEDILDDVEDLYNDIDDLIDEAEDEDEEVGDAPDLLGEAKDHLDDAKDAFDDGVYSQAISDALDAEELLEEARGEIDIISENDAEAFVEDVRDELGNARDEVSDSNADRDDVEEAEGLLDSAERRLKKADIAVDEEDFRKAADLAKEAEEMIDEALDLVDGSTKRDDDDKAEDALDDAKDELGDAWKKAEKASDKGKSTRSTEKKLAKADDLLDEAGDALDDEDYDEVLDLVDEALDLIDEALDEI